MTHSNQPPGQSCANCLFYASSDYHNDCRRHAPTTHVTGSLNLVKTSWPQTLHGNWCGEYVAARKKEE